MCCCSRKYYGLHFFKHNFLPFIQVNTVLWTKIPKVARQQHVFKVKALMSSDYNIFQIIIMTYIFVFKHMKQSWQNQCGLSVAFGPFMSVFPGHNCEREGERCNGIHYCLLQSLFSLLLLEVAIVRNVTLHLYFA